MTGTILDFSIQNNEGLISGADGNRYTFSGAEWRENSMPQRGTPVDFQPDGTRALAVYVMMAGSHVPGGAAAVRPVATAMYPHTAVATVPGQKSKVTAGVFALLLGGVGLQHFYVGAWGWGIISILFCWTYVPVVLGVVHGIRLLTMPDESFALQTSPNPGAFAFVF